MSRVHVRWTSEEREQAANLCNARASFRATCTEEAMAVLTSQGVRWWLSEYYGAFDPIVHILADRCYAVATREDTDCMEDWLEAEALLRDGWLPA